MKTESEITEEDIKFLEVLNKLDSEQDKNEIIAYIKNREIANYQREIEFLKRLMNDCKESSGCDDGDLPDYVKERITDLEKVVKGK